MHSLANFQQKLQLIEQDLQVMVSKDHELQNKFINYESNFSNYQLENQTHSDQTNQLKNDSSLLQKENSTLSAKPQNKLSSHLKEIKSFDHKSIVQTMFLIVSILKQFFFLLFKKITFMDLYFILKKFF
jgi:hypothetical protein